MKNVTVIIPAYNEGQEFAGTLASMCDYFAMHHGYRFSYLIVDDGSSDGTNAAAQSFARWRSGVRVLRHDCNRGLGAALRTAVSHADGDLAVILDADMSYSPATAMALVETLDRRNADIAFASPYAAGGAVVNVPPLRRMLSREANRLLSLSTNGRYATLTCMVRAFRTPVLRELTWRSDGMIAIAEMLLGAVRENRQIIEVPATLRWSNERRLQRGRFNAGRTLAQIIATVLLACRHRPTLWLALPGLFPGLLPLVVAILLALRVNRGTLALVTTATVVVQYTSLALFSGQIAAFIRARFKQQRRSLQFKGVHE